MSVMRAMYYAGLMLGRTLCICRDLWAWHPPVGVWIGILGLLGVIVPLVRDPQRIGKREKAIWTFVLFAFLLLEIKSVYQDRNEHDTEQRLARERSEHNFQTIANGISETIRTSERQFEATMRKSDKIMGGVSDSIRTQTGGDSFAYITFTVEPAYVNFVQKATVCQQISGSAGRDQTAPYFLVAITSHGKYPLKDIHATMMDDERRLAAMAPEGDWIKAIQSGDTEYRCIYLKPQSPEGPSGDVEVLGMYALPKGDSKRLSMAFSSPNGYWNETLHLGLVNGQWRQCLSIMGPTVKQASKPFIYCDSEWPEGKALAEKDWPRPKQKVH
jgi:hypothetical protein